MNLKTISLLTLLFFSPQAHAYRLDEHERLTLSAFTAIQSCIEGSFYENPLQSMLVAVVNGNLNEDRNVLNKWFRFSHFYHPHWQDSGSGLFRSNSRSRILQAASKIAPGAPATAKWLGALLHHIQDMTVPLHVIPVNHFWTDGFEKFTTSFSGALAFESCDLLVEAALRATPTELHQAVSEDTLRSSLNDHLLASSPSGLKIPLTWFWEEGVNGDFGRYGVLGNSFGMTWISALGRPLRIPQHEFARFKRERLEAAERATQIILMRAWLSGVFDAAQ
ncbi:MAG: hypothetical protein ACK5QT_09610 [Oligoflexia bacterium]